MDEWLEEKEMQGLEPWEKELEEAIMWGELMQLREGRALKLPHQRALDQMEPSASISYPAQP